MMPNRRVRVTHEPGTPTRHPALVLTQEFRLDDRWEPRHSVAIAFEMGPHLAADILNVWRQAKRAKRATKESGE